ncbi:unnamed protein product [Arctia plantaginis]|uniref:Uncharacterized protein n=1 Tax=Arctia plantaginis TaxID=874455 RepID=A0A8S1B3X7_ARCPL|nr:unnamed protein product [Arctia plantaginis]
MDKQIKYMKASASDGVLTEHISYHDVHHYVVIYVMLIAGAIALAGVVCWCGSVGEHDQQQPRALKRSRARKHGQRKQRAWNRRQLGKRRRITAQECLTSNFQQRATSLFRSDVLVSLQ